MSFPWVLMILVAISSIPVIIVYIWFRLAKYKFSMVWFLLAFLAGATAFFPALILQDLLDFYSIIRNSFAPPRWALFYDIFIRIAFSEEFSRFLLLLIFFWASRVFKFDEDALPKNDSARVLSYDEIKKASAAGLVAGLGFAVLENSIYAASNSGLLFLRILTAAPLHAACGSRIGAAAKMLRFHPFQACFRIFTATAIHGIYNLMVSLPGIAAITAILIAFTALGSSIITIRGGWNNDSLAGR